MTTEKQQESEKTLSSSIRDATGKNAARCYQCGKCSAGCPMAEEMSLKTHDIMRLVYMNRVERIFKNDSIWLCLTCETCTARCPNECDPARVIDALREMALRRNTGNSPREIKAFHTAFLDQIRRYGRVFDFGLIGAYKVRSRHLFQDATAAPGMIMRGKLSFTPHKIRNIDEIRRIFDACETSGKERA